MLNLAEYRSRADRLADHLPWAALVAPGIILNKDGSFMRSFAFRGPDLESATEAELVSACARANNVLKRLGSGWALFFEAERREAGIRTAPSPTRRPGWSSRSGAPGSKPRASISRVSITALWSGCRLRTAAMRRDGRWSSGLTTRRAGTGMPASPALSPRPIVCSTSCRVSCPRCGP